MSGSERSVSRLLMVPSCWRRGGKYFKGKSDTAHPILRGECVKVHAISSKNIHKHWTLTNCPSYMTSSGFPMCFILYNCTENSSLYVALKWWFHVRHLSVRVYARRCKTCWHLVEICQELGERFRWRTHNNFLILLSSLLSLALLFLFRYYYIKFISNKVCRA